MSRHGERRRLRARPADPAARRRSRRAVGSPQTRAARRRRSGTADVAISTSTPAARAAAAAKSRDVRSSTRLGGVARAAPAAVASSCRERANRPQRRVRLARGRRRGRARTGRRGECFGRGRRARRRGRRRRFSLLSLLAPAGHQLVGQAELVEHAPDHGVEQRIQRRGLRIERRRGRQHDRARARHGQHVLEVDRRQRRLAHDQHQLAPLLQHHVGGAPDQIVGDAVRDARQAAGRAGDHHHRVPARRARGERRAEVAQAVALERIGGHVADLVRPDLVARLR